MPVTPRSGCGLLFAALVYIPLFFSGAQQQMKKLTPLRTPRLCGEYNFELAQDHV